MLCADIYSCIAIREVSYDAVRTKGGECYELPCGSDSSLRNVDCSLHILEPPFADAASPRVCRIDGLRELPSFDLPAMGQDENGERCDRPARAPSGGDS